MFSHWSLFLFFKLLMATCLSYFLTTLTHLYILMTTDHRPNFLLEFLGIFFFVYIIIHLIFLPFTNPKKG